MDAKEAIEIVKENIQHIKELQNMLTGKMNTECQRDIDGFLMAIEALEKVEKLEAENARLREKETPKKPTKDGRCYKCTCGYPLYSGKAFANREKFCSRCGQRLDWSSDKE